MAQYKVGDRVRVAATVLGYHNQTGAISFIPPNPQLDVLRGALPDIEGLRIYEVTLDSGGTALFIGVDLKPE